MLRVTSEAHDRTPFREWPVWARRTTYAAVLLVLALVLSLLAAVVVARHPLPQVSGRLHVAGLTGKVDVVRDAHGIPQVYADTSSDLFLAQGYVQAQDRFFQMDVRRHVTAGRLSELFGSRTVETDMAVRTMGWRRVAEQEYDLLSPETRSYLTSFSEGVNAYVKGRSTTRMSLEYTLLGLAGPDYRPEPWTPVDSLAWLKAMAWDLTGNIDDEVARARLSVRHSAAQVAQLYPAYPYGRNAPIVPDATPAPRGASDRPPLGVQARQALAATARVRDAVPDLVGSGEGVGSNSWVVSGQHTASGKPLLANDPHLAASLPGVWYQMGLHCRTVDAGCPFDVSGFTFAGLPGVVIGHNQSIAWGMTNLDPDVADLFLEQVDGGDYLRAGREVPLTERDEVIRIAGRQSKVITVRSTPHGPLLSDVSDEVSTVGANARVPSGAPPRGNGYAVALSWTALTPGRTADAIFDLDKATDWASFRQAARSFAVPSQNLVYADTAGNIGYQAPGQIPIRKNDREGDYPAIGWRAQDDWSGRYVPFDQLPSELNPPEGFVVTANQAVTGPGYAYHLGEEFDRGYRSQRIRDVLQGRIDADSDLAVSDMTALQLDDRNPMGPVLTPYLMRQLMTSQYYADGQRLLLHWDFTQPADSAAAAYFDVVWSNVLRLTFEDQLPESLRPDGGQRWVAVVSNLLRHPESEWWDDASTEGVVEDRDTILSEAMRDARNELTRKVAESPTQWQWGKLHHLDLESQTLGQSGFAPLAAIFNRGPYRVGGGSASVDATSWDAADGYDVGSAPSMRMVVDLGDLDRSRWVNLSGASGHVLSGHYDDQTKLWLAGRTLPWAYGEKAVAKAGKDTLVLEP